MWFGIPSEKNWIDKKSWHLVLIGRIRKLESITESVASILDMRQSTKSFRARSQFVELEWKRGWVIERQCVLHNTGSTSNQSCSYTCILGELLGSNRRKEVLRGGGLFSFSVSKTFRLIPPFYDYYFLPTPTSHSLMGRAVVCEGENDRRLQFA